MVVKAEKGDYYDILGVAKDSDKKAIKQAYRQKARKFHPVSLMATHRMALQEHSGAC